jgi:glucan phosphoethanolaminetransferase (alkaline phosphatase superfamily)
VLPAAWAALPTIAVLSADLSVRWGQLHFTTRRHVLYYALSILVSGAFWLALGGLLARLFRRAPPAAWALAGAVGALEGLLLVGSLRFYRQFGVLPNLFGFEYVYEEPKDAAAFFATGADPVALAAWGAVAALTVAWLTLPRWSGAPASTRLAGALSRRRTVLPALAAVAVAAPVLHNNVRHFPDAFMPEIHTVFSFSKATERALRGRSGAVRLLGAGLRAPLSCAAGDLPFDVLVVLTEGVRRASLPTYGYERDTTPNLRRFLAEAPGRTFQFDRAYAVSTRTLLAFPSFLTGVHPVDPGTWMHTQPLLFSYGKCFGNVDTFLLSAQSFGWGNFLDFVRSPDIDTLWYQEVSGKPATHGTGMDDAHVPARLDALLAGLRPGRRFVGMLHFYGTHHGYDSRPEDRLWGDGTELDRYEASVHYLDRNLGAALDALRRAGRLDDTLVIVASDHGEAFGEHGYSGHIRTYYEEEAGIPLWIRLPRRLAEGRGALAEALRANAGLPVSNADVLPTLLALTGLDARPEIRAVTWRLRGLPLTEPLPPERSLHLKNLNDIGSASMFGGGGLVKGRYKLLERSEGGRAWQELYDLQADPRERRNLVDTAPPELLAALRAELRPAPLAAEPGARAAATPRPAP